MAGDDLVQFYCVPEFFNVIPHPKPASKYIAPWFKSVKPVNENIRDTVGAKVMTAKKCMPMLDAMTAGWVIPLYADVNIRTNDDCSLFDFGNNDIGPVVETHTVGQLGGKTSPTFPGDAIKFINPWVVKTADGISSLFMPPVNHFDKRFTCLTGLVDTDRYAKQVNFPAIWHLANHDDIVPAGTPLVTMIPVRRSDLAIEVEPRPMTDEEALFIRETEMKQISRRHVYSHELREPRK